MPLTITKIERCGEIVQVLDGASETITRSFRVSVDGITVDWQEEAIITDAGWAGIGGESLPQPLLDVMTGTRGLLICKSLRLTRKVDDPVHWLYTATWDNKPLSENEQNRADEPHPLLRRPQVTRASQMIAIPVERDRTGDPLMNTAGQIPLDPLMLEAAHETLQIESYQPAWPIFYATLQQKRTINSQAVTIRGQTFPAKTLWFWPAGIDDGKWEYGVFYFTVRFHLVVRLETWTKHVERLDSGYEHLIETPAGSGTYELVKIKLPNGEEPQAACLLNEVGFATFPQIGAPDLPHYSPSNVFEEVNFNTAFAGGKLPGIDP